MSTEIMTGRIFNCASKKYRYLVLKAVTGLMIAQLFIIVLCFSPQLMADNAMSLPEKVTHNHSKIRVAMSAAFVSESGISIYDEIFNYVGEKLGTEVVFVSGFSYSTINSMLDSGMIDVGFICGLPYVMQHDKAHAGVELLVAPVMADSKYNNQPIYYSYLITHKDSHISDFSDLKGKAFVFNDEISNSGYNMPRAYLINQNETSGFFSKVMRSGSHEESIRMVALGMADASAVDSLVYDYDLKHNSGYVSQTKIIKTLGPAGIPPVVVSSEVPLQVRERVRDILMDMNNDPAGKAILKKALVNRFTMVDDSNYDGIRKMQKLAQDTGYMKIR